MGERTFRVARPEDAEALLAIYAPYVEETAITFEYEVPSVEAFRARIAHTLSTYPYIVAVEDEKIIGYAYVGRLHERAAYDWSVETSIYIRQDAQKDGVGRWLYGALERLLARQGILNLNACIAVPPLSDTGSSLPHFVGKHRTEIAFLIAIATSLLYNINVLFCVKRGVGSHS